MNIEDKVWKLFHEFTSFAYLDAPQLYEYDDITPSIMDRLLILLHGLDYHHLYVESADIVCDGKTVGLSSNTRFIYKRNTMKVYGDICDKLLGIGCTIELKPYDEVKIQSIRIACKLLEINIPEYPKRERLTGYISFQRRCFSDDVKELGLQLKTFTISDDLMGIRSLMCSFCDSKYSRYSMTRFEIPQGLVRFVEHMIRIHRFRYCGGFYNLNDGIKKSTLYDYSTILNILYSYGFRESDQVTIQDSIMCTIEALRESIKKSKEDQIAQLHIREIIKSHVQGNDGNL